MILFLQHATLLNNNNNNKAAPPASDLLIKALVPADDAHFGDKSDTKCNRICSVKMNEQKGRPLLSCAVKWALIPLIHPAEELRKPPAAAPL